MRWLWGWVLLLAACGDGPIGVPTVASRGACAESWRPYCDAGLTRQTCCPGGAHCELADAYRACGDGLCASDPGECPSQMFAVCGGTWRTVCEDSALTTRCCGDNDGCAADGAFRICADGTCTPLGETCEAALVCEGSWEETCENGVLGSLCCPADLACGRIDPFVYCGGGRCVPRGTDCRL